MKRFLIYFIYSIGTLQLPGYILAAAREPKEPLASTFLFDRYMSPYASSPLLMSTRTGLSRAEDRLWQQPSDNLLKRCLSSFGNNLANDLLMLCSHEVNGHGFRWSSFQLSVTGYGLSTVIHANTLLPFFISLVLPMNSLGGFAQYAGEAACIDHAILLDIGGNEANSVLANEITFKYLAQGYLDYRDYNLFFKAFTNLLGYVVLLPINGSVAGNDVVSYIQAINHKHGYEGLNVKHVGLGCVTFFLNPMLYCSIWSFYVYLFKGETQQPIPRISLGEAYYMPITRMGFTPFGLMYYLDNYVHYSERTILASLQLGGSRFYSRSYSGLQLKTDRLWSYKRYSLGVESHVWHQPKLLLSSEDTLEDKNYWGGLLGIDNQLALNEHFAVNVALLYKTPGFVEGVVAAEGFLWRAGFTFCY